MKTHLMFKFFKHLFKFSERFILRPLHHGAGWGGGGGGCLCSYYTDAVYADADAAGKVVENALVVGAGAV